MTMDTPQLIDAAIALFLGYMAWKTRKVDAMSTDIAVIKQMIEAIPIGEIKADVNSNRHKIQQLDRGLAKLEERVGAMERRCDIIHQTKPSHEGRA